MMKKTVIFKPLSTTGEKEELVNTNCELQRKLQAREQDYRNETATLVEVKNKLKTWIDHIRIIAADVEAERNEN